MWHNLRAVGTNPHLIARPTTRSLTLPTTLELVHHISLYFPGLHRAENPTKTDLAAIVVDRG